MNNNNNVNIFLKEKQSLQFNLRNISNKLKDLTISINNQRRLVNTITKEVEKHKKWVLAELYKKYNEDKNKEFSNDVKRENKLNEFLRSDITYETLLKRLITEQKTLDELGDEYESIKLDFKVERECKDLLFGAMIMLGNSNI